MGIEIEKIGELLTQRRIQNEIKMANETGLPLVPDFFDADGFRCCGRCNTRKEIKSPYNADKRLPVTCACELERIKQEDEILAHKQFMIYMKDLWRDGLTDKESLRYSFSMDDRRNKSFSDTCRRYVDEWDEIWEEARKKDHPIGILFYGGVGTGKTFLSCCIADALLKRRVSTAITNFPRILNKLQGTFEKQEVIDGMNRYQMLIVDDLGAERGTEYSEEQVFSVINARYIAKKPIIITTNLSLEDLENDKNSLMQKRIYDRVLEMCPIKLKMDGQSRRKDNAQERRDIAAKIIGGTK